MYLASSKWHCKPTEEDRPVPLVEDEVESDDDEFDDDAEDDDDDDADDDEDNPSPGESVRETR